MNLFRSLVALTLLGSLAACSSTSGSQDLGGTTTDLAGADLRGADLAGDMAEECNTSCSGGKKGCPSMCTPGCGGGQLCCAYAGGACQITDAGTCANSGGFSCATPTSAGVCPIQCYP